MEHDAVSGETGGRAYLCRDLEDALAHEADIVWLEDTDGLDYVRQIQLWLHTRAAVPPKRDRDAGLVGYATLRADAPNDWPGVFIRRGFKLADHDRARDPGGVYGKGGAPCEAVDPRTVRPGFAGLRTARAEGEAT